jgi:hypothetical protein
VTAVPEAAMVAGALARLHLLAEHGDGTWRPAAMNAFAVIEASHAEAELIIATVAGTNPIAVSDPPHRHRYCRWCMIVQLRRRGETHETHKSGCLYVRALRWLGRDTEGIHTDD